MISREKVHSGKASRQHEKKRYRPGRRKGWLERDFIGANSNLVQKHDSFEEFSIPANDTDLVYLFLFNRHY